MAERTARNRVAAAKLPPKMMEQVRPRKTSAVRALKLVDKARKQEANATARQRNLQPALLLRAAVANLAEHREMASFWAALM